MEMNITQVPDATSPADTESNLPTERHRRRGRPPTYASIQERREAKNARRREIRRVQMSEQEAVKQIYELKKEVSCLRSELQQVRVDRDHQLELVQSMITRRKKFEEINENFSRDMDNALMKAVALEETCSSQQDQLKNLNYQLATANEKLKRADLTSAETLQENGAKQKMINEMKIYITDLEHQLVEEEKLRKKLHNTILELKGNIRVYCRVRPALPKIDGGGADGTVVSYPTDVENLGRGIELMQNAQKIFFTLDKVFDHEASQEDVFVEISQLVQSALDGYKVCIFAYGQTGSGKTYTMMGKPGAHEEKGLILRSVEQIFQARQSLKSQGWQYKMQVSMLEIYNETIRDLLLSSRRDYTDGSIKKQSTIKHDRTGNTHVSDLTVVDVCNINQVSFLLKQATQIRSVRKTQIIEQSSRSHFVFTLRISGVNDITKQQVQGILNLIDLAGSERLAKSGSIGDCLKETQAINKSLSALSGVMLSIAKKEDHVPYRDSKLTYLLQVIFLMQCKEFWVSKVFLFVEVILVRMMLCALASCLTAKAG